MGLIRTAAFYGMVTTALILCTGVAQAAKKDSVSGWGPWVLGSSVPLQSSDYEAVIKPGKPFPADFMVASLEKREDITLEHITVKFQVTLVQKPCDTNSGTLEGIGLITNPQVAGRESIFAPGGSYLAYVLSLIQTIWDNYDDSVLIQTFAVLDDNPYICVNPNAPIRLDDKFLRAVLVSKKGIFIAEDKVGSTVTVSWDSRQIIVMYLTPDTAIAVGYQVSNKEMF